MVGFFSMLLVVTIGSASPRLPADTLGLRQVLRSAEATYPMRAAGDLRLVEATLVLKNLAARYQPSLELTATALYQSDVPELDLPLPGGAALPSVPHEQLRVGVTITQLLYDGGVIARSQELETLSATRTDLDTRTALVTVREQVTSAYFAVLAIEKKIESVSLYADDVQARLEEVRSLVRSGLLTRSDEDRLELERLRLEQQLAEMTAASRAARDAIGILAGMAIAEDTPLGLPALDADWVQAESYRRPEYDAFDLTREEIVVRDNLLVAKNRPRALAFVEGAYGRPPGQNFFRDEFRPFYSAGVRIAWTIWDWNVRNREREVLALGRERVSMGENAFRQRIEAERVRLLREIEGLDHSLAADEEIIRLRARIADRTAVRLGNGTATAQDYVTDRHAEIRARLAHELRQISRTQARVRLLLTVGWTP